MPEPIIYVRTTIRWDTVTRTALDRQGMHGKSATALRTFIQRRTIDIWNDTFKIDYCTFRARIQALAEQNLRATGLEIIYGPNQLQQLLQSNRAAWIIPVDDDDFFHPQIGDAVRHRDGDVLHWRDWYLRRGRVIPRAWLAQFATNGYAVRAAVVRTRGVSVVMQHKAARTLLRKQRIVRLGGRLSAANKSIASVRHLLELTDPARKSIGLRECAELIVARPFAKTPVWLTPYVRALRNLHLGLLHG